MAGPSYDIQVYKQYSTLLIAGRFLPASEGFLTSQKIGRGFTVAAEGSGVYLVTLDETFNAAIAGDANPAGEGDNLDFAARIGDLSAVPFSSFRVYCQDGGTDGNYSGGSSPTWCSFWVLVSHTSQYGVRT